VRFPKLRYSSKYFAQIYRDEYLRARGTPTLRPENSVNIWNLLWLSRRLIICTEQTGIYIYIDQNLLVIICSINIVLHSKSLRYSLNILTNRNSHATKHQFQSKFPFFQKTIPFARGNEANKRYPCKLCYSFPFNPPKVIKHCVVPEYVHIPPQNALEIPEGGSGLKGQKL